MLSLATGARPVAVDRCASRAEALWSTVRSLSGNMCAGAVPSIPRSNTLVSTGVLMVGIDAWSYSYGRVVGVGRYES
jgi:hypothetical protein